MKAKLPSGEIIDLTEWMRQGSEQQAKYIDAMIEKYYLKLKLQRTLKLIEKILNEQCSGTFR